MNREIHSQNTYLINACTQTIPRNLEQTTTLKMYKCEHPAKENIQIVNKHIKNTKKSYFIRKLQIKTPVKYHCTPIRTSKLKKIKKKNKTNRGFLGGSVVKNPLDNLRLNLNPLARNIPHATGQLSFFFPKAKQGSAED